MESSLAKKAASFHFGVDKYNCAQAVLKTFQGSHSVSDEAIVEFKAFGGGKAEDGLCGALYAAICLMEHDDEKIEKLKDEFLEMAGSLKCREIRSLGKLSCKKCVSASAVLLNRLSTEN